jgi:hypothetical protein
LARKKLNEEAKNIDSDILSSEEEVQLALRFAQAYSQSLGIYPSAFNPQLLNSRLQDITLRSGAKITGDSVAKALENPKSSEKELLSMSESFEITSAPYRRLISYMSDILAWDLTYYCKNIKKTSEYTSKAYKDDLDIVKSFLYAFDYKKEFSTVIKQLYREDTFFCIFRDDGERFVLQQLASDYCMITSRFDYGLLFTFDYSFFLRQGIDLDLFPPIFKETYRKLFTKGSADSYDPSINIDLRRDSVWTYFADCSPSDGFWGFKLNPAVTTRTPFFCGLFPDLANQNLIRNLQKSSYMAECVKILAMQIPMLHKNTQAVVKDEYAMSPEVTGKFLQLMRSAINESVNVASAPMEDIHGIEFTSSNNIQSSWTKNALGNSGINTNLLYSGGDYRMNQQETLLSVAIDELASMEIYPYCSNFLEYQINKRTKHYKFGFEFEGSNLFTDRQRRLDNAMQLANIGVVNPMAFSAALGKNPFVFQAQLDEARANGWVDNLTPIIPAAQQSGAESKTGRPSKSDTELGDAGAETRSEGANISKLKSNK